MADGPSTSMEMDTPMAARFVDIQSYKGTYFKLLPDAGDVVFFFC